MERRPLERPSHQQIDARILRGTQQGLSRLDSRRYFSHERSRDALLPRADTPGFAPRLSRCGFPTPHASGSFCEKTMPSFSFCSD